MIPSRRCRRSLALLVPGNIRVDTVTADDSLRCTTDGAAVTVGGAEYLLRADFDARHWTAALRVLLAREIQHDSSSDRDVCAAFAADAGAYFHAHYALAPETGALLGHRILNILEQARTDNILCRRFPGYLPLLRFVCYAQLEAVEPDSALEALLCELETFALTGIPCRDPALSAVRAEVEAAILAPSAAACADIGRRVLAALAPELARLCSIADADVLARIASQLVDYAFSEADRAEAFGDGCDSRLRLHSEEQDAAHSGPSADGEDADLDKGDSAAGGSGDNTERHGDMSGSLASQEVKVERFSRDQRQGGSRPVVQRRPQRQSRPERGDRHHVGRCLPRRKRPPAGRRACAKCLARAGARTAALRSARPRRTPCSPRRRRRSRASARSSSSCMLRLRVPPGSMPASGRAWLTVTPV